MRTRKLPAWLPPVAFVGVLGAALFLSNQTAPLPSGDVPIGNDAEYTEAMARMEGLSRDRIKAADAGETLTPDDLAKLREASRITDRMAAYAPLMASLFFISGKIHHVLGEDQVAEERFRQSALGIDKQIKAQPSDAANLTATGAEANYQLSILLLPKRDLKGALAAAEAAVKMVPQSSSYLTARASALNELRRTDEAKRDLQKALALDPANRRAAALLRLISH